MNKLLIILLLSSTAYSAEPVIKEIVSNMKFVESPVWNAETKTLYFSDTQDDKFYKWTEAEGAQVVRTPAGKPNGNRITADGTIYTCEHWGRRIAVTKNGKTETLVDSFEGKKLNSPNDCTLKSDGTLWFTDPPWGLEGRAQEQGGSYVFRVNLADKTITAVVKTAKKPNGIALSPDEKFLYVGDSGKIMKYPIKKDGTVGEGSVHAKVRCDGFRMNSKGIIFATIRGPKNKVGIDIVSPAGKVIRKISLPEPTTNLCLVDDGKVIYASTLTKVFKIELK